MDPVTLLVTALTVGASKAVESAAAEDIKAAYDAVKSKVLALVRGNRKAELAVLDGADDPDAGPVLTQELAAVAGRVSQSTLDAARLLMSLVDASGTASGTYDLRGAQGVQIGESNQQSNTFNNYR